MTEGEAGEAFGDAPVGGGVRVQVVGQREFGVVALAVEVEAVEVVQMGVGGRALRDDPGQLVADDGEGQLAAELSPGSPMATNRSRPSLIAL